MAGSFQWRTCGVVSTTKQLASPRIILKCEVYSGVVGALGSGQLADWLGRRAVIILALLITFAAVTVEFIATSNAVFFAGKFLNGFATGAISSVAVTYIGEARFPF